MFHSIKELGKAELEGKVVLVRVDFNVQVYEGKILDDLRIRKTLPTIEYLRTNGAKIILISHNESKDGTGLRPIAEYINNTYVTQCGTVTFVEDFLSEGVHETIKNLHNGQVVLFENLRVNPGEKEDNPTFAKALSAYAELYVNDAFAVSHRPHASVVGVPVLFPGKKYAGIQLEAELNSLMIACNPPHPFIFILGGAKFDSKLPLIQKFSQHADTIYLGGALLNDVLKAKGYPVGKSLVSSGNFDMTAVISNPKLVIPNDVIVERDVEGKKTAVTVSLSQVEENDMIMDVGPSFTESLKKDLAGGARFVLWNGPMGNYEKGYKEQTIGMAEAIYASKAQAVLGGGDTTAAIAELGLEEKKGDSHNKNIFISTGGGAMLEYLENETLPGVEALN